MELVPPPQLDKSLALCLIGQTPTDAFGKQDADEPRRALVPAERDVLTRDQHRMHSNKLFLNYLYFPLPPDSNVLYLKSWRHRAAIGGTQLNQLTI